MKMNLKWIGWSGLLFFQSTVCLAFHLSGYGLASFSSATALGLGFSAQTLPVQYGYGAGLGFSMLPKTFLELGLIYGKRGFQETLTQASSSSNVIMTTLQIPVVLRIYLNRLFSVGVGGYYSYALNSSYEVDSIPVAYNTPSGVNDWSSQDYGVLCSLGVRIKLIPWVALVGDVRYLLGLANMNASTANSDSSMSLSDLQVLFGLQLWR